MSSSTCPRPRWSTASRICACSLVVLLGWPTAAWGVVPAPTLGAPKGCDDTIQLDVRTAVVGGVEGNWIAPSSMNRLMFVLETCLPSYRRLVAVQTTLVDLQAKSVKTASAAVAAAEEVDGDQKLRADTWKQAYLDEHQALQDERSFWRSPILWFGIGAAIAAIATVGIANAIRPAVVGSAVVGGTP